MKKKMTGGMEVKASPLSFPRKREPMLKYHAKHPEQQSKEHFPLHVLCAKQSVRHKGSGGSVHILIRKDEDASNFCGFEEKGYNLAVGANLGWVPAFAGMTKVGLKKE